MESLFHTILQGDITVFQVRGEGSATHAVLVVVEVGRCFKRILTHGLVGFFVVEVPDTFDIGIGQHSATMVANHSGGI